MSNFSIQRDNPAANLLRTYTVGVATFLVHELCMTNPHALLQCFTVLAAWTGWQEADQLRVKVLQSDMLSVEQHEIHMWHQNIQPHYRTSCYCVVLAVQNSQIFLVDYALTFFPCCTLIVCIIVTCLAVTYKDHAYRDHGSVTSMSMSKLISS